jgi:DNA-binding YbaB/EbfC family protein
MSKGRRQRGIGGQSGQLGGMLQQVQKLQEEMVKAQEALADETVSVTAGGGAIEVTITGQQRLMAVKMDPEIVDPEDVEMLQDLIVAAVNEAIEQSQALAAERLGALTGGLGLPPGLGLG